MDCSRVRWLFFMMDDFPHQIITVLCYFWDWQLKFVSHLFFFVVSFEFSTCQKLLPGNWIAHQIFIIFARLELIWQQELSRARVRSESPDGHKPFAHLSSLYGEWLVPVQPQLFIAKSGGRDLLDPSSTSFGVFPILGFGVERGGASGPR